jgi:hypothetical protein
VPAAKDGRIVEVLDEIGGLAVLDVLGAGDPATQAQLDGLGISTEELQTVAERFDPGATLWRIEIDHFSDWDKNKGVEPDCGGCDPTVSSCICIPEVDDVPNQADSCSSEAGGSIIECHNMSLGEDVPLAGTGAALHYRSRTYSPGNGLGYDLPRRAKAYDLDTPTGSGDFMGRFMTLDVLGTKTEKPIDGPVYVEELAWDGRDRYGRFVQGAVEGELCVTFVIRTRPVFFGPSPSGPGSAGSPSIFGYTGSSLGVRISVPSPTVGSPSYITRCKPVTVGGWDITRLSTGLGKWMLSMHHHYSTATGELLYGSGEVRNVDSAPRVTTTVPLLGGDMRDVAFGPDGQMFVLYKNAPGRNVIARVDPEIGAATVIAGGGPFEFFQEGAPSTGIYISDGAEEIAVRRDGSVVLADFDGAIYEFRADGTAHRIAGVVGSFAPLNAPTQAKGTPLPGRARTIAVSSIDEIYVGTGNAVVRIDNSGRMDPLFAGDNCTRFGSGVFPDPNAIGVAADRTCAPYGAVQSITIDGEDNVYFSFFRFPGSVASIVGRITPSNQFDIVAGWGSTFPLGNETIVGESAKTTVFLQISSLEYDEANDRLLVLEQAGPSAVEGSRLWAIHRDGTYVRLAGSRPGTGGDLGPATSARLESPKGVGAAPDGTLFVVEQSRVREFSRLMSD